MSSTLAAAYPAAPVPSPTPAVGNYPFPTYTANNYSFAANVNGNSVWGEDLNNNNTLDAGEDTNSNGVLDRDVFPSIAPDGTPVIDSTSLTQNGQIPMLPGMSKVAPQAVARSLWYRTASSGGTGTLANNSPTGDSSTVRYSLLNNGGTSTYLNLFIYNTSYDSTVADPTATGTFNPNQPAPLILPATVCIDTTTGLVDKTCASTPTASYLSLNAPVNNVFPDGSLANQPASSFTVCGVTGRSRRYQAYEQRGSSVGADFTGNTCPTDRGNPRQAIVTFASGLSATNFTTGTAVSLSGTAPNFTVNAASSTKVNVLDLTAANFTSFLREDGNGNGILDPGEDLNGNGILDRVATLTLNANGNPDPTFLLRAPDSDVTIDGLYVRLNGVDPNKVFWLFPRTGPTALTIGRSAATIATIGQNNNPTVLVGNLIGTMPATAGTKANSTGLNIGPTYGGKGVSIRSARFLGFRAVTIATAQSATELAAAPASPPGSAAIGVDGSALMTAMTTVDQPMVVPVTQLHSPITQTVASATDGVTMPQPNIGTERTIKGINGIPLTSGTIDGTGQWMQRASAATVNIYFVAGNTPSRSYVQYTPSITAVNQNTIYTGESGGGLNNFVRFLENWRGQNLNISGGFIQNTRSVFATAPFSPNSPFTTLSTTGCTSSLTYATRNTCFDASSDIQTWFLNPSSTTTVAHSLSNFTKYYQSTIPQAIPFYAPPNRKWGFDVGLLVQQPDLFAQRFSQALPNFNEFFREAPTTDPWVQTML
ncbi:MAG: hypothetical protein ACK5QB_17050, partial [Pseudanabaena sp.]